MVGRDRDLTGRPRNTRGRDEFGRPLARGEDGIQAIPDDLDLTPEQALTEAQRLLDAGRAFQAHEVLEASWKAAAEPERELWRGLAQLAVGVTHAQRGNGVGAIRLLRRGADRIGAYVAEPPYALDVAGLVDWVRTVTATIERDGVESLAVGQLVAPLRP